jgi:hypothetical protein
MGSCVVSYLDISGIRHTVEVTADSLFEGRGSGNSHFREHDCEPGSLRIEIRSSVTHTVTLRRVEEWLNGGARNPKEAVMKERLREMLGSNT